MNTVIDVESIDRTGLLQPYGVGKGSVMEIRDMERELLRHSFYEFVKRFWTTIIAEPMVDNWHIRYLCDEMQTMAERVFKRLPKEGDMVVNVPPGSTKSSICSVMFPAWCWTRDPTLRMICASHSDSLSMDLATRTFRVLTSDKYIEVFPELRLVKEAIGDLITSKGGQRKVTSTGARITGFHAHIIILDDLIDPQRAVSEVELKKCNEWLTQTIPSRVVSAALTPIFLVMQRLHEDDPTRHVLANGMNPKHFCFPAELSDDVRPRNMRSRYIDGLFDVIRLPKRVLEQKHKELLDYGYAGQYLQRPVPPSGGMFKTDAIRRNILASPPKCVKTVRAWDKAGTLKGGAFTVGTLMGQERDRSFVVLDVIRGQWEASEREQIIRQTAERDGKEVHIIVEQEPGSGGKESAQATARNLAGFRVKLDRPTGDKSSRADPFACMVNAGCVKMVRGLWNEAYLAEMQFFPYSKYKDQIDSSSSAFSALNTVRRMVGGLENLGDWAGPR